MASKHKAAQKQLKEQLAKQAMERTLSRFWASIPADDVSRQADFFRRLAALQDKLKGGE